MESSWLRAVLRAWVALVLAFLFIPIVLIVLYAFNQSNIESWPIAGFSLHWFGVAWHDAQVRSAFLLSVRVGLVATALALLLGSAVAYALYKFRFFGREAISFLLVLPLALPGIITGIALNSFFSFTGVQLGTLTIIVGHTTFCIVLVYNNLIARLRRTPGSLAEASMDLGARGWQTLRFVTLPLSATALVSGALLAFGLSFDEVIVTVFTAGAQNTLPLWIFGAIRLGQQLPEVNAVVSIVILLTIIPVVLAARLAAPARSPGQRAWSASPRSAREVMPSLRNACRRWVSTVAWVMNRCSAICRLLELLGGQRGGLVVLAERAVRGDRGGTPGRDRRVLRAQGLPARGGREQVLERIGRAVHGDLQRAAGLPEQQRVEPALRRFSAGGSRVAAARSSSSRGGSSGPSRAASSSATGRASMRAARCASQRSDGASAQCASSTASTSGWRAARFATSQYKPCMVA